MQVNLSMNNSLKIEHIALWVKDLDKMKNFYMKYLKMKCGKKYINKNNRFSSFFLSFGEGARLELMHHPDIQRNSGNEVLTTGFAHFSISLGGFKAVDELTETLRKDSYRIVGEPRTTGDGYYESVILDPEGNRIELTE